MPLSDVQLAWGVWKGRMLTRLQEIRAGLKDLAGGNMRAARYHLQHGNYTDALWRYKLVTRLQPRNAAAWAGLGACLVAQQELVSARQALREALHLDPAQPVALEAMEILDRYVAQLTEQAKQEGGA